MKALFTVLLAPLRWGWTAVCAAGNYVVDPPARHLKVYMLLVIVTFFIGYWVGDTIEAWVKHQLYSGGMSMQRFLDQGVVTTTPPPEPVTLGSEKRGPPEMSPPQPVDNAAPRAEAPIKRVRKTVRKIKAKKAAESEQKWPF